MELLFTFIGYTSNRSIFHKQEKKNSNNEIAVTYQLRNVLHPKYPQDDFKKADQSGKRNNGQYQKQNKDKDRAFYYFFPPFHIGTYFHSRNFMRQENSKLDCRHSIAINGSLCRKETAARWLSK